MAFEARAYDPRVGVFLSQDPLAQKYPGQSPYVFAANNPIRLIDVLGMGPGDPEIISFDITQVISGWLGNIKYKFSGRSLTTAEDIEAKVVSQQAANHVRKALEKGAERADVYGSFFPGHSAFKSYIKGDLVEGTAWAGVDAFGGLALSKTFAAFKGLGGKLFSGSSTVAPKVVPDGLSMSTFETMSDLIKSKVGHISEDVVVQGSRAAGTANPTSDIDIAIKVGSDKFDELINTFFKTPNPGSAKERTMQHAVKTGKIQAGEAKLSGLSQQLREMLGMDVDISVIKTGGSFDNGVQLPLKPKN